MNIVEPINISIIFYSMYGHTYRMAKAVSKGAQKEDDTIVELYQVPELVPDNVLKESGAKDAKESFAHISEATPGVLEESDAVIFGTPTRFGMMASQMRNFLDQTGKQWAEGALIGKVGSVFASIGGQHGGHETTITSFYNTLIHHGMLVVGVPYSEQRLSYMDEISGGSPYGATTITGPDGSRQPSENELAIARTQGKRVAEITKQIFYSEVKLSAN